VIRLHKRPTNFGRRCRSIRPHHSTSSRRPWPTIPDFFSIRVRLTNILLDLELHSPTRFLSFQDSQSFNTKLFQCIDRAVTTIGTGVKEALYFQIQQKYGTKISDFRGDPVEFVGHLHDILGEKGSPVVDRLILLEIRSSFGVQLDLETTELEEAIRTCKRMYLS
jgi:hypothetical protein